MLIPIYLTVSFSLDFFQVFVDQGIDGSSLLMLGESHLTGILGLKLGPTIRLIKAVKGLKKREEEFEENEDVLKVD